MLKHLWVSHLPHMIWYMQVHSSSFVFSRGSNPAVLSLAPREIPKATPEAHRIWHRTQKDNSAATRPHCVPELRVKGLASTDLANRAHQVEVAGQPARSVHKIEGQASHRLHGVEAVGTWGPFRGQTGRASPARRHTSPSGELGVG